MKVVNLVGIGGDVKLEQTGGTAMVGVELGVCGVCGMSG